MAKLDLSKGLQGCCQARYKEAAEKLEATISEVANVLQMLDELAELWGDEGKFRACRDRLRKLLHTRPMADYRDQASDEHESREKQDNAAYAAYVANKGVAWTGGGCPVPDDHLVEYVTANGATGEAAAEELEWLHIKGWPGNIVAYRDLTAYLAEQGEEKP